MASDDSFKPTDGMIEEAKRGLAWRQKYDRGGTLVGVARARDIVSGKRLSADTVRRMASFFARHEVDKKGKGFTPGPQFPSPGRIAWALWGGDAGATWSKQIAARLAKRGNVATMIEMRYRGFSIERSLLESRNCGTGSGGFQPGNDCARSTGGGRYDHSPGEPRIAAYKSKEGADARDAQGREYPPTVTSLADRQSWDDDIQAAELDPGYDPQDVVDDIIVDKFGDVDIEAGFSGTKFISQGANPALQEWMDKQGFKGPPAKAMEQIVRMAEAEAWERIKRDARDIAAKKLRARTSTTYPPGKGPIRRWLLDLQKHLLEMRADCESGADKPTQKTQEGRTAEQYTPDMDTTMLIELRKLGYTAAQALFIIRNCGTGAGGFSEGNDCAKGKAGKDGDGDGEVEGGGSKGAGDRSRAKDTESRIDRKQFSTVDTNDTKAVDALYKKAEAEADRLGELYGNASDKFEGLDEDPRSEADAKSDEYKSWVAERKEAERIMTEASEAQDALRDRMFDIQRYTSAEIARDEKNRQQKEAKEAARKKQEELAKQPKVKAPRKPRGPRTAARVAEEIKEIEETERLGKALGLTTVDDQGREVQDPSIARELKALKREQKELERQEKKAAKAKGKTKPSAKKRSFTHRLMELRRAGIPAAVAIRMARGDND